MRLKAAQWLMTLAVITPWLGGLIALGVLGYGVYGLFAKDIRLGLLLYFFVAAFIGWVARFVSGLMFATSQALMTSAIRSLQQESGNSDSQG